VLTPSVVGELATERFNPADLSLSQAQALVRHGLAAEVASQPGTLRPEPNTWHVIEQAARYAVMQSMVVASTAVRATSVLGEGGVRALCVKGPVLALQTTGSWRGRGSADVDLLIDPRDAARAHAVLTEAGWTRSDGKTHPPGRAFMWRECEVGYSGTGVPIDLHWRMEANPKILDLDFDVMWERSVDAQIAGDCLRMPGVSDSLLITAVHGARSGWYLWRWALDAYRQFRDLTEEQAWEVRELAMRSGSAPSLALAGGVVLECGLAPIASPVAPSAQMARLGAALLAGTEEGRAPVRSWQAAITRRKEALEMSESVGVSLSGATRAAVRAVRNRKLYASI